MFDKTVAAPKLQTAVLSWEVNPNFCREAYTLLAGSGAARVIAIGTVLGKITKGAIAVAEAVFTGTGNGTLTLADPAYGAGVQEGDYVVRLIEAGTDAGAFAVIRPDGTLDGYAVVGVAYDGQVKFTIADGATDFAAAAQFVLAVTIVDGSGKVVAFAPAATDGSEVPWGVDINAAYAADAADGAGLAVARGPVILKAAGLVWPDGVSADQKAAALAVLEDKGIIVRS